MRCRLDRVLNACRRQRSVHTASLRQQTLVPGCSTPVGVKDRFTLFGSARPDRVGRAQRLSASKIGSRAGKDVLTGMIDVLNACRRQRSVHNELRTAAGDGWQVLNACRRQRSVHASVATTMNYYVVLNACRRQRSVHADGGHGADRSFPVLNACRRQRSVHLDVG